MKVDVRVTGGGKDKARGQRMFTPDRDDVLGGSKPLTIRFFDGATKPCWKICEQVSVTEFKTWGDETDYLYEGRKVFLRFKTETAWSETGSYEVDDFVLHEGKTYICMQDHESSSETEPGNSTGYWSIAEFSVTVVSSVYDVDDDETTCEVEEEQVFAEAYSFKKWADIPEWCGELSQLGTSTFTANTVNFRMINYKTDSEYYANDHLVAESVIVDEYDEEGKTDEEIELIWDRKPLFSVEGRDADQRWEMLDGKYNFRIRLVRGPSDDPEHDVSPDLDEDDEILGNWEIEEDEDNGGVIYKNNKIGGNYGIRFQEVGTRSYCHYFESMGTLTQNDIKYAIDWFCPDGIFFAPFDTTDETNFSVTTSPEYSADGESGVFISPTIGDIEIYLMPRRWLYRCAHRTGKFTDTGSPVPYPVELPQYGYCVEGFLNDLWTHNNIHLYEDFRYEAIWWDRPPNQLCLKSLSDKEVPLYLGVFPEIRRARYYASGSSEDPTYGDVGSWSFSSAQYVEGGDYHMCMFAGDVFYDVYDYYFYVAKIDAPRVPYSSFPDEWERAQLLGRSNYTAIGDEDKEAILDKMTDVGASQEEIDAVISGYNSIHYCSAALGDVHITRPPGAIESAYNVRECWNQSSKANGKMFETDGSGLLSTSDDDFGCVWNKIENSEFWSEYGYLSDVNEEHSHTRYGGAPYGIAISPHKTGSLVAIIKTQKQVYYIWRKKDEEFNLYLYSEESYSGHDVIFEKEVFPEFGWRISYGALSGFNHTGICSPNISRSWSQFDIEENRKLVKFGKPLIGLRTKSHYWYEDFTYWRSCFYPSDEASYELDMPAYVVFARERYLPQYFDVELYGGGLKIKNLVYDDAVLDFQSFLTGKELIVVDGSYDEWEESVLYADSDTVKYRKKDYECLIEHTSSKNNNPLVDQETWKLKITKLTVASSTYHNNDDPPWVEVYVNETIPSGITKVLSKWGKYETFGGAEDEDQYGGYRYYCYTKASGQYDGLLIPGWEPYNDVDERNSYD